MLAKIAPLIACVLLISVLGGVHGISTDRWGPSGQLQQALERLPNVPKQFGDWKGEDIPTDDESMPQIGIQGYIHRRYQDTVSRQAVVLLIVCGRGGPICVHTPDVCYANAGYKQLNDENRLEISCNDGRKDSFTFARFGKPDGVVPAQLDIFWSWSRDGTEWQSPERPRLMFARTKSLYKLYLEHEFVPSMRLENANTCTGFLQQLLPAIRQGFQLTGP
jgi:hypothetical protein